MKHSILCVDDEVDNVEALERLLRKNFNVITATSGEKALEVLRKQPVSAIISDQRMPNMTGVEFLEKSIAVRPDAVRILLTGYTDIESVISAINSGQIYRYLTKPWDPNDLLATLQTAIEKFELREQLREKNQELSKALSELQKLDIAKSHFMILINHELKTPLTALLSFLELLSESKLDQEQRLYTEKMNKSAQRLKEIIQDVLELMSAETGQLALSKKKQTFSEVIKAAAKTSLGDKKDVLVIKTENEKLSASFDEKLVLNVLNRLLSNAIKFRSNEKPISIEVKSALENRVSISITNDGEALSKEIIDHILKPFTLNENIMNHTKGMGLGLAVCQALLKRHSSQLEINCKGGKFTASFELAN